MKQIKCKQKSTGDMIIIKVRYDADWQEYQVIVLVNGNLVDDYTSYESDRESAVQTQHAQYDWFKTH